MTRNVLPTRRHHWLFDFEHDGQHYIAGIGRFPDGSLAEVFINGAKVGSSVEAGAQEAALAVSLALQHGCPLETMRHAMTYNGRATGPLGALLLKVNDD